MKISLAYFDPSARNWVRYKYFASTKEAQKYVDDYPRFGQVLSRIIREGNWQIIKE